MKTKITLDVIYPIVTGVSSAIVNYRELRKAKPENQKSSGYAKIMFALGTISLALAVSDLVEDFISERKKKNSKDSLKEAKAKVAKAAQDLDNSINSLDTIKDKVDALKKDLDNKSVDDKDENNK